MKLKIFSILAVCALTLTSCNDVLDRPPFTSMEDDTFWTGEDRVRLYANSFYTNFFVGYGLGYGETEYTPNTHYTFNDNLRVRYLLPKEARRKSWLGKNSFRVLRGTLHGCVKPM